MVAFQICANLVTVTIVGCTLVDICRGRRSLITLQEHLHNSLPSHPWPRVLLYPGLQKHSSAEAAGVEGSVVACRAHGVQKVLLLVPALYVPGAQAVQTMQRSKECQCNNETYVSIWRRIRSNHWLCICVLRCPGGRIRDCRKRDTKRQPQCHIRR